MLSAKKICNSQTGDEGWNCLLRHRDSFFWTDDEDPVRTWNHRSESTFEFSPIRREWREELLWLTYRDLSIQVPLRSDRIDRWILIHTMAQLVSGDFEFRFCKDSTHSSDQAYLVLSVTEWMALESEFGSEKVAQRFLRLNPDFNVFCEEAFSPEKVQLGRLDPSLTNWIGGHPISRLILTM